MGTPPCETPPLPQNEVPVWGWVQRCLHWTLALTVLGSLVLEDRVDPHMLLGYAALAVAVWRTLGGWFGPARWRFSAFVQGPRATLAYVRDVTRGRARRHLNHNPLGAWMVMALLASALVAGGSGALFNTDTFWGSEWLERVHALSGTLFYVLAPVHVLGVVLSSWQHRENLVRAMLNGRKRAPRGDDDLS